MYNTLIEVETLNDHLNTADWVIVDCRFSLADTSAGREAYLEAHIPGAVYAHLDNDLSGPPLTDSGRHPLPSPDALAALFGRLGIGADTQVVAYDNAGGMIASRLWWMLRYMGHTTAAVLNGGWQTWQAAGYPTTSGAEHNTAAVFTGKPNHDQLVRLENVLDAKLLVDSRDAPRYRGEVEPIDSIGGHIPGAVNFPFRQNLGTDGRILPPEQLRANFAPLLEGQTADEATFYCGSGVSACVNLLALNHAGLGSGRLYVGSWSEWSADENRPMITNTP